MRTRPLRLAILPLCLLPLPALAQDATITPGNTLAEAPAEWLGATLHLVLIGTLSGRPVDIQILDVAAAQRIATLEGKRERSSASTASRCRSARRW